MRKRYDLDERSEDHDRADSAHISQILSYIPHSALFTFKNGDEYEGQFATIREKLKIVKEGRGIYRTANNEIYDGIWEDDSLREVHKIVYADKSMFSGVLEEMMMKGTGKLKYKEGVEIEGFFSENNLTGKVYLKDPNKKIWKGEVKADETHICFSPLHTFWQSIVSNMALKRQMYCGEECEESYDSDFIY